MSNNIFRLFLCDAALTAFIPLSMPNISDTKLLAPHVFFKGGQGLIEKPTFPVDTG